MNGINYYRVRIVSRSGELVYSKLVTAVVNNVSAGISVYPNPVAGHVLHVSLSVKKPTVYTLLLADGLGHTVMQEPLKHSGGNMSYTIFMNAAIPPGRYILMLQEPGEAPVQKSLVIL